MFQGHFAGSFLTPLSHPGKNGLFHSPGASSTVYYTAKAVTSSCPLSLPDCTLLKEELPLNPVCGA